MFELKVITHFAAAHQIRGIAGSCERLHGHNWKIEVVVTGKELGEDGLLVDFKILKKRTEKILEELDHRFLNELPPFKEKSPSSENIAEYVFQALARDLDTDNAKVSRVTAWESESACATYMGS